MINYLRTLLLILPRKQSGQFLRVWLFALRLLQTKVQIRSLLAWPSTRAFGFCILDFRLTGHIQPGTRLSRNVRLVYAYFTSLNIVSHFRIHSSSHFITDLPCRGESLWSCIVRTTNSLSHWERFGLAGRGGSGTSDWESSRKGSKSGSSSTLSLASNVSRLPGRRMSEGKRVSKVWRPRSRHSSVSMTSMKMVREAVQSSFESKYSWRARWDDFWPMNRVAWTQWVGQDIYTTN